MTDFSYDGETGLHCKDSRATRRRWFGSQPRLSYLTEGEDKTRFERPHGCWHARRVFPSISMWALAHHEGPDWRSR